jgi:hypothetical protein
VDTIPVFHQVQNQTCLSWNLYGGEAHIVNAHEIGQEDWNIEVKRAILLMLCAGIMIVAVAVGVALGVLKGKVVIAREVMIPSNLESLLSDPSVFHFEAITSD